MKAFALSTCTAALAVVSASIFSPEAAAAGKASQEQLEADVRFLADDARQGREAGTPGYDDAAAYVAKRMKEMGLKPGGDDGTYLQKVNLVQFALDPEGGHAASFDGSQGSGELVLGEDYAPTASPLSDVGEVEADAVFAGYGFVSERYGFNDFEGVDVNGKVAVMIFGLPQLPAGVNSEEQAHFFGQAAVEASKRGAVGTLFLFTPQLEARIPFSQFAARSLRGRTRMGWASPDGKVFSRSPNVKTSATMGVAGARKLFAAGGHSYDDLIARMSTPGGKVSAFDMGVKVKMKTHSKRSKLTSPNVAGIIEGSDKKLKKEYVVVSAHLDHVGVRPTDAPDDDEIFNGAMDNATGIAASLDAARGLMENRPKRSVIILAVTAEEKGLIGADFFAHHPTVAKDAVVANVNLDMPVMTYDFRDLVAFGAERSTLFKAVQDAVSDAGLALSPDPMPEQGIFTRSDHYRFVQQGVPSAYLMPGFANGGGTAWQEFFQQHYHRQSDEVELVQFDQLARFADIKQNIIRNISNMKERPKWRAGDFFGETFNGPMADADDIASLRVEYTGVMPMRTVGLQSVQWPHGVEHCVTWADPCIGSH